MPRHSTTVALFRDARVADDSGARGLALNGNAVDMEEEARYRMRALVRKKATTLEQAREHMIFYGSYGRLSAILKLHVRAGLPTVDMLTLLGEMWSGCDANGRAGGEILQIILPDCATPEMMTEAERAALAALPERVTVYRGADRGVNEQGLCWSLDRTTAARFPFLSRYLAKHPVLVTAVVDRTHIVAVKFDRGEAEVITKRAVVSAVAELPAGK